MSSVVAGISIIRICGELSFLIRPMTINVDYLLFGTLDAHVHNLH